MHEKLKWTLICVLISNPNIELLLSDLHCTVGKFGNTAHHFVPQKQCSYTSLPDFYQEIIRVQEGAEFGCVFWKLKEFVALTGLPAAPGWFTGESPSIVYTLHTYNLLATHSALHCRARTNVLPIPAAASSQYQMGGQKENCFGPKLKDKLRLNEKKFVANGWESVSHGWIVCSAARVDKQFSRPHNPSVHCDSVCEAAIAWVSWQLQNSSPCVWVAARRRDDDEGRLLIASVRLIMLL